MTDAAEVHRGQAVYTPRTLRFYDVLVHGLTNPLVWRCETEELLDWTSRHVGLSHCDVGVGTGYLLDHARGAQRMQRLVLIDLNKDCLEATASRLARFSPIKVCANVLEPIADSVGTFDSIGLGYLLHCVPGRIDTEKACVFDHLGHLLRADGVLFGSTLLGAPLASTRRARWLMAAYNRKGIFHNTEDSEAGLHAALSARFREYEIVRRGEIALFSAHGYLGTSSSSA